MDRVRANFGGTEYSRRKVEERERKIVEFQIAIQRQGRSLKKLLNQRDSMNVSHYERREEHYEYQMKKSMKRRETEYQLPPQLEQYGNITDNQQLDYLQSSHYEKHLQQIMTGNIKQTDNAQKIENIRSKNIYLLKHYRKASTNQQKKEDKQTFEQRMKQEIRSHYNVQHSHKVNNYQKITNTVISYPFRSINCFPYLQNSSVLQLISEEKHNDQSGVSTTSPTCWNEPLKNITVYQRNSSHNTSNQRKSYQDLQNVRTVIKHERNHTESNEHMLRPSIHGNSQAKKERNLFIDNMLRQQKENKQPLPLKQPQPQKKHALKYQRANQQTTINKTPLKTSHLSHTNQRQVDVRPNTSFTEDSGQNHNHHSQYIADFKLERPEQSRRISRSASAINFDQDRSYLSKIQAKIKTLHQHHYGNN